MAIIINEGFDVNAPSTIDKRLIVDRVNGTTASLVSLTPQYNYANMYVWVKEEKAFYYLNNIVDDNGNPGATVSDWTKLLSGSGGSASAIDLTEVAFGTGTGITSSRNFTFVTSNPTLIFGSGSTICSSSRLSAIIGGCNNTIGTASCNSGIFGGCNNNLGTSSQSVIIGGQSNILYNNSCNSAIIGGVGLTLSNESNVVYVPELKIATASNSSTTDKVLVWDTTDNYVKWRSDSSLGLAKNAKKVAWQSDTGMPGQLSSWGLTAGQDPNTVIFYNGGNSFDSPQGDVVVSLNPATATPGLNRDFKLILGNFGRVETGNTWSVAYNGTRLVEYGVGRVEPHVLDFSWATSSEVPNGEYLLTKYMLELPLDDFKTTGSAYGRDFQGVKRMMGFYGVVNSETSTGGSNVFPKGSILFVNEAFVYCEAQTTTVSGVTISFGLNNPPNDNSGSYGTPITSWEPSLASFGVSTSGSILFPPQPVGDFATGSIYYSTSPVGIIRLTQPAMVVLTVTGGSVNAGTFLKFMVPYIVDEASLNAISGTNFIAAPAGTVTGATGCAKSGYVSGASFAGTGTSSASIVFSTPYSSASYSVVVTSQAFTTTDYVYSVTDKTASGFIIRTPSTGPIGATAMWITNCYDGSGLSSGGGGAAGAQGPTGPGGGSAIDLEEIAFGTGTGITSSNSLTWDDLSSNLISSCNSSINSSFNSSIIGGFGSLIKDSCGSIVIGGGCYGYTPFSGVSGGNEIIGGFNNFLVGGLYKTFIGGACNFPNKITNSNSSSILAGKLNTMTSSNYSSIIGGYCGSLTQSDYSSIIGGSKNKINLSCNSIILGGNNLEMNSIDNMVYVPSVRGFGSVQFDLATSSSNYTLTQDNFTLLAYPTITGMTVSLPTAISSPHRLYVIKKDGSSTQSIVYIDPNVSDTIEGYAGSIELINPWDYNILQSDGVNMWIKLGGAVGINL